MVRSQTQASNETPDPCSFDSIAFGNSQEHGHGIALIRVDAQPTAITRLGSQCESKFRVSLKVGFIRRFVLHEPIDRSIRIRRI